MSDTEPSGAIARLFNGPVTDVRFAGDGSLLVASGSTLYRFDPGSGMALGQYALPRAIWAFDVSTDGRYIYLAVSPSGLPAQLLRIDTQDDSAASYLVGTWGEAGIDISDLACLEDGTVLLTLMGLNLPLLRFDPDKEDFKAADGSFTSGTLIASDDDDTVLILDYWGGPYVFSTDGTSRDPVDPTPYMGPGGSAHPRPSGAVSADGSMLLYPFEGVFSPSGGTVYFANSDVLLASDVAAKQPLAAYRLLPDAKGRAAVAADAYATKGEVVQVSKDGRYLSVITTTGVQVIDLTLAVPFADDESDNISEGYLLLGLGGNDTLGGPGTQDMRGGSGDDTYLVDQLNEQIVELADEGIDKILLSNSFGQYFYMPGGVENLTYVGTGRLLAHGNNNPNLIIGGALNDWINAVGESVDTLYGGGGDDKLTAESPAGHALLGEAGNDLIVMGFGNNADGGADFDRLQLSFALALEGVAFDTGPLLTGQPFVLAGGTIQNFEALEEIVGSSFADSFIVSGPTGVARLSVRSGQGDDVITATDLSITGRGGEGDDRFVSGSAADHFYGEDGFDTVDYRSYALGVTVSLAEYRGPDGDVLYTMEGVIGSNYDDVITGSHTSNRLNGWLGDDLIDGGGGIDDLNGGSGQDRLFGGWGNDKLNGGTGDDELHGGEDSDTASGGYGNDLIAGDSGDDLLAGGEGADHLQGGIGKDRLNGGAGNDVLIGGTGADYMHGAAGADTFVFARGDSGFALGTRDQIDQFEYGIDKIDLTALAGATASIVNGTSYDILLINFDDGGADMAIRVNHAGGGTLTLDHILL